MPKSFTEKAAEIELQLAQVEHDLLHAETDAQRTPLQAQRGSLLRSLMWYRVRLPRRIESVGVLVQDEILTSEAQ